MGWKCLSSNLRLYRGICCDGLMIKHKAAVTNAGTHDGASTPGLHTTEQWSYQFFAVLYRGVRVSEKNAYWLCYIFPCARNA